MQQHLNPEDLVALVTVGTKFGPMRAYKDDMITKQIIEFGNHTRPEFAFATCVLNLGDAVFDIGAHIGTFAMTAANAIGPTGRLLCVEGSAPTFALLSENVGDRADAVNALVSATSGARLYMPEILADKENTGGLVACEGDGDVPVHSLDDLVSRHFRPGYVKIDIEGMEAGVLLASQYVREATPILYFEVHLKAMADQGGSVQDLQEWLAGLGYGLFVNVGPRNARFDGFKVKRIEAINKHGVFFDVLCVPKKSAAFGLLSKIAA